MDEIESLVRRSVDGDERAFGRLIDRYKAMAYGYAYSILGDFHLAEDVAQEAFIDAWVRLDSLRIPDAFPSWLRRIVFKHCDRIRRRRSHATVDIDDAPELPSQSVDPETQVVENEMRHRILAAIGQLPQEKRTAVTLFYMDGYTQNEIAEFLHVPLGTVKSRLSDARDRLRKEMLDMVEDTFAQNGLPEEFTEETIRRAIEAAEKLRREDKYGEAETILRSTLEHAPNHPGLLKEMNRNTMHGHVYGKGEWGRLPEIAERGRRILDASAGDDEARRQTALTLLSIPAMNEAVAFLEEWIGVSGPSLERNSMLAWARGCIGDYESAVVEWERTLGLPADVSTDAVEHLTEGCTALVDCLAAAGSEEAAREVASSGYRRCAEVADHRWIRIAWQGGLDYHEIGRSVLRYHERLADDDPKHAAGAMAARAWVLPSDEFLPAWLDWLTTQEAREAIGRDRLLRIHIQGAFRKTRRCVEFTKWAEETWRVMSKTDLYDDLPGVSSWQWEADNIWPYIDSGDYSQGERLIRKAIDRYGYSESPSENGYRWYGPSYIQILAGLGTPTPEDLRRALADGGIEAVDDYGMFGEYLTARIAAESGDRDFALEALERALGYWSNPPYLCPDTWERDAAWGNLLELPERKELFDERRRRIGPIYGELHFFPGW